MKCDQTDYEVIEEAAHVIDFLMDIIKRKCPEAMTPHEADVAGLINFKLSNIHKRMDRRGALGEKT